jgi:hypothetical protein
MAAAGGARHAGDCGQLRSAVRLAAAIRVVSRGPARVFYCAVW